MSSVCAVCFTELKEPVGQIVCTDKGILAVEQNKVLVPPAWNKTFAWGYADLSCRLSNYESDKVIRNIQVLQFAHVFSICCERMSDPEMHLGKEHLQNFAYL